MFAADFELTSFEPLVANTQTALAAQYAVVDIDRGLCVFTQRSRLWFDTDNLAALEHTQSVIRVGEPISVGHDTQAQYWVVCVRRAPDAPAGESNLSAATNPWRGLRDLFDSLEVTEFAVIARAVALARWRIEHRFCGRCGRKTGTDKIDGARSCRPCRLRFYPRIAPCMIVLVMRDNQILLAHHTRATREVFSPLAGFIEAGETPEAAVAREVYEEVGIRVRNIRYFASQSWPFPGQLMLAYYADYDAGTLNWREHEIRHADWFALDALPQTPSDKSVAGWLIREAVHNFSISR